MRVVKCSEPERFQPVGYWAQQGLATEDEVRWEMLWQAVTVDTELAKQAREHAEGCDYCGDVMDRFMRLKYAMKPEKPVELAICPSSADLYDFLHDSLGPEIRQKVAAHIPKCTFCAGEVKWLQKSEAKSKKPLIMTPRAKMITGLAVAAGLMIGAFSLVTVKRHTEFTPIEDVTYSTKYRNLAHLPLLDRNDLTKASPPSHWATLDKAMSALELGDTRRAVGLAAKLVNDKDEPAAEYVLGRALYREKMVSASKEALLKAEAMSPMSSYRCWTALQIALILGDKPVILRECKHLEGDPTYGEESKKILEEVNRRG